MEILQREGLRHACRSTESLGKRVLFLLDNMAMVLGASKCRGGTPNLNHTGREICVISLAAFTIPVCRWIASEDNLADEPSRSKRYRPITYSDIDQRGMTAKGSTPGSELFAVLSAGAARVAGEEAQSRKLSRVRSCAGVAGLSRGRTEPCPTTTTNSGPRCSGESGLSAPSSASRPSSSGAEPPQPRFSATQSRSTSF